MDLEKAGETRMYNFMNWKNSEEKPMRMHPSTKKRKSSSMTRTLDNEFSEWEIK